MHNQLFLRFVNPEMSLKTSMTASNVGVWERHRSLNPAFELAETFFLSIFLSSKSFLVYFRLSFRKYHSWFVQEEYRLALVSVHTYRLYVPIPMAIRVFMYMYRAMTN